MSFSVSLQKKNKCDCLTHTSTILALLCKAAMSSEKMMLRYIVAGHLQRGSAIRWREDIEMDVAKISGGASNLSDTIDG